MYALLPMSNQKRDAKKRIKIKWASQSKLTMMMKYMAYGIYRKTRATMRWGQM